MEFLVSPRDLQREAGHRGSTVHWQMGRRLVELLPETRIFIVPERLRIAVKSSVFKSDFEMLREAVIAERRRDGALQFVGDHSPHAALAGKAFSDTCEGMAGS